jgi:FtsH-binding integral membrane protein
MKNFNFNNTSSFGASSNAKMNEGLRNYMVYVYQNMSLALGISGLVAFLFSQSAGLMQAIHGSPLGIIIALSPIAIAFFFGFKIQSMQLSTARLLFWVFAALMGASLSSIFLIYTNESITRSFFITASTFLAMSIYGYTTKKDLTSMGSLMITGLIGIIIASLVNIFLKSSGLSFVISILSVIVFVGLTAYDTQKIKDMYYNLENSSIDANTARKIAIMGALSLYMDFINLFIAILRLVGDRRND